MKYKIPMLLTATVEIEIEANTFDPTNFEVDYDLLDFVEGTYELSGLLDDKDRT